MTKPVWTAGAFVFVACVLGGWLSVRSELKPVAAAKCQRWFVCSTAGPCWWTRCLITAPKEEQQ